LVTLNFRQKDVCSSCIVLQNPEGIAKTVGRQRPQHILITTKINRPAVVAKWVKRPRLISRLNEGRKRRVTLISAPAGYGKTTLVVQWLEQVTGHAAWLSLEKSDSDPERFLKYVIASIRTVFPKFGLKTESLLFSPTLPPPGYLADTLIADLAALNKPLVIALDDFYTIVSEPAQMILTRVVQYQPDNLHMVILTRIDPPLPIGLWRVREWLNEVRVADLRFSREEARDFFNLSPENAISAETVDMLQSRTEGWVAGLQLAQLSLTDADNPDQHARSFSGKDRYVFDFLVEEVISKQPAEIRDFLAVTAGFDRFCASLCDFAMGNKSGSHNSQKLITLLERENLFLVPLDSERGWYRYHHLFQSLLMQHLKDHLSPEHKVRIHRLAGEWFAGQGLIEEALPHLIAGGELSAAVSLVEKNLHVIIDHDFSRHDLRRWLATFPESAKQNEPALLVAQAFLMMVNWNHLSIGQTLDRAEALVRDQKESLPENRRKRLESDLAVLRLFLYYWTGQINLAQQQAERTLGIVPRELHYAHDLAVMYTAGTKALSGCHEEALRLLSDELAKDYSQGGRSAGPFLLARAVIQTFACDLDGIEDTARRILETHETTPIPIYWYGYADYFLGSVAYERNLLGLARDYFERALLLRYQVSTRHYQDYLVGLALVALARGYIDEAEDHLASVRTYALEMNDPTSLQIAASLETRLAIFSGKIPETLFESSAAAEITSFWLERPSLTKAEYLVYRNYPENCDAALLYIGDALKEIERYHNDRLILQFTLVKAVALNGKGESAAALRTLEMTLRRAESQGLVRTFVDRGPLMADLLKSLLKKSPRDNYVRNLLAAFAPEISPDTLRVSTEGLTAAANRLFELSSREMDVLILLAERLSNKEIAERLFISPDTVKRHSANIYRKLDVRSRRQAVATARKLGLLPAK